MFYLVFSTLFLAATSISCNVIKVDNVTSPEEISPTPCDVSPCENNATCVSIGDDEYMCTCRVGYYGDNCQEALPCTGSPCQNGAKCQNSNRANYTCACDAGYWGVHCEHAYPCTSCPCQNEAVCENMNTTDYQCHCGDDFHGDNCEKPYPCNADPCSDRGSCDNINTTDYHCNCTSRYYGNRCQFRMPCYTNPCSYGGTCVDVTTSEYRCVCVPGKTGRQCTTDVYCGTSSYLSGDQHATMSSSYSYRYRRQYGAVRSCSCSSGYYSIPSCSTRCEADGAWKLTSPCLPTECGDPPEVLNGTVLHVTNSTYGGVVTYGCVNGSYMARNGSYYCAQTRTNYRYGEWWVRSQEPVCIPYPDCGVPPNVTDGYVIRTNATAQYGMAVYGCYDNATMIGDGIARCWWQGRYQSIREFNVRSLDWLYVPQCERKCHLPEGRTGNQSAVMVKVTKCTTRSFNRFPDETCGDPVFYHVAKNETQRESLVFYGDELCGAWKSVKIKKTLKTEQSDCKVFCIPGRHGYHRMVVKETLEYNSLKVILNRESLKFQTVDME